MRLLRRGLALNVEPPLPTDRYIAATIDDPDSLETPVLHLERSSWEDMGSPAVITCTIEPGDRLTPAPEPCD